MSPRRTYEANICSGSCDLGTPAEHPHGSLTQMVGLHSTAGPCCSPRKMTAINMLYLDQDYNVILGKLPSMKVHMSSSSSSSILHPEGSKPSDHTPPGAEVWVQVRGLSLQCTVHHLPGHYYWHGMPGLHTPGMICQDCILLA